MVREYWHRTSESNILMLSIFSSMCHSLKYLSPDGCCIVYNCIMPYLLLCETFDLILEAILLKVPFCSQQKILVLPGFCSVHNCVMPLCIDFTLWNLRSNNTILMGISFIDYIILFRFSGAMYLPLCFLAVLSWLCFICTKFLLVATTFQLRQSDDFLGFLCNWFQ